MKEWEDDLEKAQNGGKPLSPAHPILNGSSEDILRRPPKLNIIDQSTSPDENMQELHAWNPNDRSKNFFMKDDDKFTIFRRNGDDDFHDRVRGKTGYSSGFHYWELHCPKGSFDGCTVGVATKEAQIDSGKQIGYDQESYGWEIGANKCYHDFPAFAYWKLPVGLDGMGVDFKVGKNVWCYLDMDEGYLAFEAEYQYVVAFRGLKGKTLYPMVTYNTNDKDVTLYYRGGFNSSDEPSTCNCKGCTRIVISEYCFCCSNECVIDHDGMCRGEESSISPALPTLHSSTKDNLRRPFQLDIILHSTPPDENIQELHTWNPNDRSKNLFMKVDDKFTIYRNEDETKFRDRIRGKMGYSSGFHVWKLSYKKGNLSAWDVGVATKEAQIDSGKHIGYDQESYGWLPYQNECDHVHPRFSSWRYPIGLEGMGGDEDFEVGDKLYCILDMDEGFLAFATDEKYLGVAFSGLKGKTLYPIFGTWDDCEITMKYLGGLYLTDKPSPCSCKGCTSLVISEYCKDCSDECVIDYQGTCRKDRSLSPVNASVIGSIEDNLRRPFQLDIILQSNPPNENIQEHYAWNPNDRSPNIYVKDDDKFTISRRNGFTFFYDFIRGKMGYSRGIHVWQLHGRGGWLGLADVGVTTKEVRMDSDECIGHEDERYEWRIDLNECCHSFPRFTEWSFPVGLDGIESDDKFKVKDKLYCILNMDEGYLAFATDEQYLGVAFRGLKGKTLYPIVSMGDFCEITMKYLGGVNGPDDISHCSCVGCTNLVLSEYCKDCSDECVIEHEGTCRNDLSLSPLHPILHGSLEENLRRPHKLDIILHSNRPNKNIQERNAWNPPDRSSNISVKNDDKFTFRRNGNTDLFARVRGKIGYSKGFHVWKLHSPNGSRDWLDVGVATENSQLDSGNPNGFDQESYGWHIFLKKCYHDSPRFTEWKFPVGLKGVESSEQFEVPDKLYCILDMDEGYLAFATDEQYLGVAFKGLKGKKLYPMVSSRLSCEVTMKYLGGLNLWDEPSSCLCKGCPHHIIGWYCKECSDKCEIDHDKKGDGDGEDSGITKEHSDAIDADAMIYPSSWSGFNNLLTVVRDFVHIIITGRLVNATERAMYKLYGRDSTL